MFNPLFTVATLLLLATSGACDTAAIPGVAAELEKAVVALDLGTLTLAEKVAHYQSLTDVVKDLGEGIGLGDTCLAHHIYMTAPLNISKASLTGTNYATEAIKPTNYSEPVIAGLLAVAKADVYALKQMVEISTTVLAGLALLQADDAAEKAVAAAIQRKDGKTVDKVLTDVEKTTTYKTEIATYKTELTKSKLEEMKTDIGKVLKDNVKNAMSTLAPVEEVIYALAQGNTTTTGGLIAASADTNAALKLNQGAAKLAKDTSTMIDGYFAALTTVGVTATIAKTQLTGLKKITTAATKADLGKVENLDGKDFFDPADAYQKAFVKYVKALLPKGTNDLTKLKLIAEANSVIGQVVAATATTTGAAAEAKVLDAKRKTYVLAIGEKITDIAVATGAGAVICGRKNLTDVIPGIATT